MGFGSGGVDATVIGGGALFRQRGLWVGGCEIAVAKMVAHTFKKQVSLRSESGTLLYIVQHASTKRQCIMLLIKK